MAKEIRCPSCGHTGAMRWQMASKDWEFMMKVEKLLERGKADGIIGNNVRIFSCSHCGQTFLAEDK